MRFSFCSQEISVFRHGERSCITTIFKIFMDYEGSERKLELLLELLNTN